ncbi:hypothetical protein LXA43DRAFT_456733 [Ganoderma leucocontextum]|nr:hypothetical protein LXA43DRAFT_456733 [Ganoderma leucocontextum]
MVEECRKLTNIKFNPDEFKAIGFSLQDQAVQPGPSDIPLNIAPPMLSVSREQQSRDLRSRIQDQLELSRWWWFLEFVPTAYPAAIDTLSMNWGWGRLIPDPEHAPFFHHSLHPTVKEREAFANLAGGQYKPKARGYEQLSDWQG